MQTIRPLGTLANFHILTISGAVMPHFCTTTPRSAPRAKFHIDRCNTSPLRPTLTTRSADYRVYVRPSYAGIVSKRSNKYHQTFSPSESHTYYSFSTENVMAIFRRGTPWRGRRIQGGGEKLRFSTNITIYLGNVTSLEHSYCGMRIGNRTHAFYDTILNDLEWLGEIFNDTKHRAVSPRYLSFLSDGPLSKRIPACCPAGSPGGKHVIHFRLQPACDDRGGPSHFCIPYFLDPISSFAPRSYWKLCENVHVDDKCFYNLVFCLPEATKLKTDRLPTHAHKCLKFRKVVQTIHPSRAGTFMSKVPNFDRFGAVVHISEQTKNVKFGTVSNFTLIGVTYPQCFIQTPKHWGEITTAGGSTIERRRREVESP